MPVEQHTHTLTGSFLDRIPGAMEHAFQDTWLTLPILLALYMALEWYQHRFGERQIQRVLRKSAWAPAFGAVLGLLPQCGISVFATSLFVLQRITPGTLIATYLATSDEAIPVLAGHGGAAWYIFPLMGGKLLLATLAGFIVDHSPLRRFLETIQEREKPLLPIIPDKLDHFHDPFPGMKVIFRHALKHTINIFAWVFGVSVALVLALSYIDRPSLFSAMTSAPFIEILAVGIFGLIPNCAASVTIAQAFAYGGISAGAAFAGLSAGAGFGPIILLRENRITSSFKILVVTLGFALAAGWAIQIAVQ
ncbi:MAG: hypothetical protein GXO82_08760 [Chlorobi bacterium]|nr:hypothetical protein [Chlorobiota bacterium]